MAKADQFKANFKKYKNNEEKLKSLFSKTAAEEIANSILEAANEEFGFTLWSTVIALSTVEDEKELFRIVKEILVKLNRDQLTTKALNDFYSRLCIELPKYSLSFVVKLGFFCENHTQIGDSRFFADILPCVLQILDRDDQEVTFDGITQTCKAYRQTIISGILSKPLKVSALTSTVSMFKDIPLEKHQTELLIGKICENFSNVLPSEIGSLSLACFNLALFNKLVVPVLALDNYFFNKRYKKKFAEMDSEANVESIDEVSENGVIEAEKNVIFYFQSVTEFTSIEKDIVNSLKPLAYTPKLIISPFIATVLVSFAKMSSSSVGNLRLPQSILLPFLKQVFKNNEKHRDILQNSAWARSVDQFENVDIEKVLKVLQENTCKLRQNVALNGFIGLTFILLKTKGAPALNSFAVQFLNELVKERSEFTSDIMKIVVKMLFSESNKAPIIECFSTMMQNRALPIDRCEEALTDLIENLTELEIDTALAIESVIYGAITRSMKLHELMTVKMRSAMYQNKPGMRKLAVYAFCVMLRKVTKPSANHFEAYVPSQNISMMSLMSQSQLPPTEKANMRRVSVMVLEILGLLQKCFSHSADIRITLYESLLSAVSANPFIIPNVLELIEPYIRDYFDSDAPDTVINFAKAFKQLNGGEIVVMDHLGKFLGFFIGCLDIAEKKLKEDGHLQVTNFRKIIDKLIDNIEKVTLQQLEIFSTLNVKSSSTITQFLNCLEALMVYCFQNDRMSTENIVKLKKLFDKHQKITSEALKLQENCKKTKKGKNQSNQTVHDPSSPKIEIKFDCIWDLKACGDMLTLIFMEAENEKMNELKQSQEFFRFVLKSTSKNISMLMTAPEYLKVKHSKSTFTALKKYSKVIFLQLELDKFTTFYEQFDVESAVLLTEVFKNATNTLNTIYNTAHKWEEFLVHLTDSNRSIDFMIGEASSKIQKIIDWAYSHEDDIFDDANGEKLIFNLFSILEVLFKHLQNLPTGRTRDTYTWLLKFCKSTEVKQKTLHIVNRIFFQMMIQQDAGNAIMEHIAFKISSIYGFLEATNPPAEATQNDLASISIATADQTFIYFSNVIKKQIEDVEFCVLRMNSFNAHVKLPGQESRNESISALNSLELSCVIKLTHLGKVIGRLSNTRFILRGSQIETIGRIGISYFNCIGNLIRHFNQHFNLKNLNFNQIPLELLMKETKATVKQIYALAPYIDDAIEEEFKKQSKDKSGQKKKPAPAKEFKYMSRLVLAVEKFSTSVQKLDMLTKKNFKKFIHTGDMRDFSIKEKNAASRQGSSIVSTDDDSEDNSMQLSGSTNSTNKTKTTKHPPKRSFLNSSDSDSDATQIDEEEEESMPRVPIRRGDFEKNLRNLGKKVAKPKRK